MLAYHNDAALKAQFIRLLDWHKTQDKIVQGTYQDDEESTAQYTVNGWSFKSFGRGCAVGCSIESLRIITGQSSFDTEYDDHALYETYIGVPQILARLEDGIFEGLPIERAREWPIQFGAAIRPGADLSLVWPRFAVWLLADPSDGVIRFAKTDKQRAAIQQVADLYSRLLEGATVAIGEWKAAADAADAAYAYAAADAAYAAAYAAAAYAAAYAAAADAAYAYAAYAAAAYAKQQSRIRQAEKLLDLLQAA